MKRKLKEEKDDMKRQSQQPADPSRQTGRPARVDDYQPTTGRTNDTHTHTQTVTFSLDPGAKYCREHVCMSVRSHIA